MSEIADKLIDWYGVNGRDLPWRRTRDPYRIWLSEVILQQTRIAQGMDYYLRFIARFPDVGALAAADEDEVLKLWHFKISKTSVLLCETLQVSKYTLYNYLEEARSGRGDNSSEE